MAAAWAWARTELRTRGRATVVLVLLVGVSLGAVLTAAAGARRTDTAFDRFLDASAAADLRVQYSSDDDIDEEVLRRLHSDPRVEAALPIFFTVGFTEESEYDIGVVHSPDPAFLRDIDRLRLSDGRIPARDAADEIVAGEFLAKGMSLELGDRMSLITFSQVQLDTEAFDQEPAGPVLDLEVVGIGRSPDDLASEDNSILYAGPAYYEQNAGKAGGFGPSLEIRLSDGADGEAVVDDALDGFTFAEAVEIEGTETRTARVQDATRVLAIGLLLFAACAGLAALVACGQAVSRRLTAVAVDDLALQAMGFTRSQRFAGALLTAAPVAVAGGTLGVAVAVAASPLMPIGIARRAEPSPGVDVDLSVLALGAVGAVVLLLAMSAVSAWRLTGGRVGAAATAAQATRARRSAGAAAASSAGWSPSAVLGITMALEPGRGRTAVPVRPALVGAVAGIAGVVAALTFGSSLDRLVTTPADYGWNWSISPDLFEGEAEIVAGLPEVTDVGTLLFRQTEVEGRQVQGIAVQTVEGSPSLTVLRGRMPSNEAEIALGPKTADDLGKSIGDDVMVRADDGDLEVTVVGEVLFPVLNENPFNDGLAFHADLAGEIEQSDGFGAAMVGFAPGVTDENGIAAVRAALPESLSVYAYPEPPGDVANLAQVRSMPFALAAFLVVVALAAVGHALVTSVRRRRRDIGIVRSLGFFRREVLSSVAVQSATLITVGLVTGIPLGVALGRSAWSLVADGLGVASSPTIPALALVVLVPAALIAATGIAMLPALAAARVRAAEALRAE